ncbi:hypothetical protein CHLNCDRAFT_53838 [Chlorella variabilis]|uniref:Mitochondrial arginine transporter BAC2 n=1 Tax=Chlorella variabilis TaxID=554065 RepID=E1ZLM5_CHLVA|nr:hypothetical protein CHLNCDRAFT_53838 [Chlorella variabilis]EFN53292.1 hypothetical protein CHLNCDRAFT_53838 [Chlorella variabilis]|eukprot:XP_005845394.1 hypothetical protein CHLNCDRAFT_53838 [Chlorella variabilis]
MEEGLEPSVLQLSEGTRDFLAGGIGGAFGVIAGQPLDTIRIRQQQPGAGGAGARQFARAILAAEGGRSFFRGMGYPLCTAALQTAVVFQAYGIAARHLAGGQPTTALSLPQVFYAGCFAEGPAGAPGYVDPLALLASILRSEGPRGLYRGTAITCIRDFPSHGVYFAVYEACRELFEPGSRAGGSDSAAALWVAGGLAGTLSWLSVYPFDVVKTRMQAAAASQSVYAGSHAAEGAQAFFRGLTTTLGRAFLVNGAIFTAYEVAHKLLSQQAPAAAAQAREV